MTAGRRCVVVRVTGRVQGVGFRAWTRGEALKRGLDGWVRNERDGSVKAVIAGADAAVSAMLEALRHGPDSAVVRDVVREQAHDEGFDGFRIAP